MSDTTYTEVSLSETKKVVVKNTIIYNGVEAANEIDINESLPTPTNSNQYEQFAKYINRSYGLTTDETKRVYLALYRKLINQFFISYEDSVFIKTKTELGTNFSGAELLRDLDFLGLVDVQNLKDTLFKELNEDPCLVINTEQNTLIEPLKLQMVKNNFYLACRTHIIDFSLKNLLFSSVFENKSFYTQDTSLLNFSFDTFIQRLKKVSNSYYNSLVVLLHDELESKLNNGIEFISKITNKKIEFTIPAITEEIKEENSVKYLKYLFENQFVFICDKLDSFYNRTITNNGTTIKLSPLYNVRDYFINNLETILNNATASGRADSNKFYFAINPVINYTTTKTKISISLSFRKEFGFTDLIPLITSSEVEIDGLIRDEDETSLIPQNVLTSLKAEVIQDNKFDMLFNYCFPLYKILNFCSISNIYMSSKYYEGSNTAFEPCIKTTENTHKIILGNSNDPLCESIDSDLSFGFNLEIAKLIAQAPIAIIKGIEETFDPNIAIAYRLKQAAESLGAPDVSIIPYSAPLLLPPPAGPAIPIIPPWGFIYWGISAAETALSWQKNGAGNIDFDDNGSFDFVNPFKPKC